MQYVYLLKYTVNYTNEIKYKVFTKIENAINFHKNYKHYILKNAYIEHYEILVMELNINS
ncbi:hypothetical protein [Spiroplasma endosymbiont of Nebria brevicollis]|uniref:hypothetical protein n=1 Tax=Spiroplasma endosymbiont of Nebria brevicollis TaxID=3066284 RepID=UPI00313D00EF